jgi:hypothetical protein
MDTLVIVHCNALSRIFNSSTTWCRSTRAGRAAKTGNVSVRVRGGGCSMVRQPTINAALRGGEGLSTSSREWAGNSGSVFGIDRPNPFIAARARTNGILDCLVFHLHPGVLVIPNWASERDARSTNFRIGTLDGVHVHADPLSGTENHHAGLSPVAGALQEQ